MCYKNKPGAKRWKGEFSVDNTLDSSFSSGDTSPLSKWGSLSNKDHGKLGIFNPALSPPLPFGTRYTLDSSTYKKGLDDYVQVFCKQINAVLNLTPTFYIIITECLCTVSAVLTIIIREVDRVNSQRKALNERAKDLCKARSRNAAKTIFFFYLVSLFKSRDLILWNTKVSSSGLGSDW